MFSVLTTTNNNNKGRRSEETFGGDKYVYDIDSGNGCIGVYISPNSSSYVHFTYTAFSMSIISVK